MDCPSYLAMLLVVMLQDQSPFWLAFWLDKTSLSKRPEVEGNFFLFNVPYNLAKQLAS